jgi:uncharacterized protein YegP (UPF0339 family)
MYFQIYKGKDGWRWRLKAANHETVAVGEAYRDRGDCLHAIALLRKVTADTPVTEVEA